MEFDEFGRKVKDTTIQVADKAGEVAKNIGKKAGNLIEEGKVNSRIKHMENAIEDDFTSLGRILYDCRGNIADNAEITALIADIDKQYDDIAVLRSDLAGLRGEVYCKNCGKYNPAESKFCNNCGADFKTEE